LNFSSGEGLNNYLPNEGFANWATLGLLTKQGLRVFLGPFLDLPKKVGNLGMFEFFEAKSCHKSRQLIAMGQRESIAWEI
jgi:hypothetical protein